MASYEKLPNGKWRSRWRGPDGRQHQKTHATEADARLHAATRDVELANGTYIDPAMRRLTFREYAPRWLASKRRLAPSTFERYEGALRVNIYPLLGDVPVSTLRHVHVEDLIETMQAAGAAAKTIQKAVDVVRQVCARARKENLLHVDPCEGVELPAAQRREMLYLTPAELERLCSKMRPDAALLVRFLGYTGLRWGEATALTVGDIDVLRRRVRVDKSMNPRGVVGPTKTRNVRWVPLEASLASDVVEFLEPRRSDPSALVFCTPSGRRVHPSNFRRDHWAPAKEAAAIHAGLRLHDLRHSCATWLISTGADVYRVMRWMGHSNIQTTVNTYGHMFNNALDDLADALSTLRTREGDGPATVAKVTAL